MKTINDLLKLIEDIKLPHIYSENSLFKHLSHFFKSYKEKINQINDTDDFEQEQESNPGVFIKKTLNHLIDNLLLSIELFYEGKISDSFNKFENALNVPKVKQFDDIFKIVELKEKYHLFRIRTNENIYSGDFTEEQLFHVPFELRNTITTKRYSIPGFPCLYLSSSTYLCWEELNRPDLNKVTATRFSVNKNLKLLDLTIPDFLKASQREKYYYFMTFPLLLVCSIKVHNHTDVFKPEYIIPQFLLEYIRKDEHNLNLDGIKYESTKLNRILVSSTEHYNIVLPVKKTKDVGYCEELLNKFTISKPISFQVLEIVTPSMPDLPIHSDKVRRLRSNFNLLSFDDTKVTMSKNYARSTFGKMELKFLERDGE